MEIKFLIRGSFSKLEANVSLAWLYYIICLGRQIERRIKQFVPFATVGTRIITVTSHEHRGVSNHQPICLFNPLSRCTSKTTWKLRVTGFCKGKSTGHWWILPERTTNAENVSIPWSHYVITKWNGNNFCVTGSLWGLVTIVMATRWTLSFNIDPIRAMFFRENIRYIYILCRSSTLIRHR